MEVGVDVWVKDHKGSSAWVEAIVESKVQTANGIEITTRSEEGLIFQFKLKSEGDELEDVKLRNSPSESNVENLIKLPYLHEPAILYCLQMRYASSDIYTFTGPILIAVNPFKKVNLYSPQILETYYNFGLLKAQGIDSMAPLSPHIYSIADAAYREMMTVIMNNYGSAVKSASANQSILISGESGAGKTESTKIVLKYLTTVGSSSGPAATEVGSIMDKVLQSNPILEAFGNARTIRNDNSSRFGKFIELNFNRRGHLIGGTIKTYLLEKVRLATQQTGERNFHIFYQMAAGGTPEQHRLWGLTSIEDFWYTNQGSTFTLRHVDDSDEFRHLLQALTTLNFNEDDQQALLNIMAGLLHFGQLQFVHDKDGEGSDLDENVTVVNALQSMCGLCGISSADLVRTLTIRRLVTREETVEKKHTPSQASDARDALAKTIYGKLFQWIVQKINQSIQNDPAQVRADINVLDIFGFECFQHNSFEQLCINYTNETLQQQFNQFVFKMEQIEYQKEKIEWSFIEFPDNQDCLDLIEHRQHGILAMLDDECRLPRATDEKLASRLYKSLDAHPRFAASVVQKRDSMFCIRHYAGLVLYSTFSFIDKNKDELPKEAYLLLQSSTVNLLSSLFATPAAPASATNKPGHRGSIHGAGAAVPTVASVGTQFKEQLHQLMEKVYSTTPHYIRCLKPNDENVPDDFNRMRTTEQLRYGGVLEVVRVARSGFPVRLSPVDFYARYRPLANPFNSLTRGLPRLITKDANPKDKCEQLLLTLWDETTAADAHEDFSDQSSAVTRRSSVMRDMDEWKGVSANTSMEWVQLGISKVFLRKQAHDVLESRRSKRLLSAAKRIQAVFRGYVLHKVFMITKLAARVVQRLVRGHFARTKVYFMRRESSCLRLQACYRRFISQRTYRYFRFATILLQSGFRARKGRAYAGTVRYTRDSKRLSKILRGAFQRYKFRLYRFRVVALQCLYRCKLAKRSLKSLKVAAKDVGRLKQSNEALKAEIEKLRAKAADEAKKLQEQVLRQAEQHAASARQSEIATIQTELEATKIQLAEERARRADAENRLLRAEDRMKVMESEAQSHVAALAKAREVGPTSLRGVFDSELITVEEVPRAASPSLPPPAARSTSEDYTNSSLAKPAAASRIGKFMKRHSDDERTTLVAAPPSSSVADAALLRRLEDELANERSGKSVLEEEVARLRKISMELNAQIDHLKKSGESAGNHPANPMRRRSSIGQNSHPLAASNTVSSNGSVASVSEDRKSSGQNRRMSLRKEALEQVASNPQKWDDDDDDDNSEVLSQDSVDLRSVTSERRQSNGAINVGAVAPQQSRSALTLPGTPHPMGKVPHGASPEAVVGKFEKNLGMWQAKLMAGIKAVFWEAQKISKMEGIMKLDVQSHKLHFDLTSARRGIAGFFNRAEMQPIKLADIFECLQGAEIASEAANEARFITIVSTAASGEAPRIIAFKLETKEERNSLLTGLRSVISEIHGHPSQIPRASVSKVDFSSPSGSESAGPSTTVRTTRRLSVRDVVLEETIHASTGTMNGTAQSGGPVSATRRTSVSTTSLTKDADVSLQTSLDEMRRLLIVERTTKERLYLQNLGLTNDLNERDEQVFLLKKRDAELTAAIANKDKMYEQDALVRMQLGKRLEQILMDKEEAVEQYEMLKDQFQTLKESIALMQVGADSK